MIKKKQVIDKGGYVEVIEFEPVKIKNTTSIIQIYYDAHGESLILKPGESGTLMKGVRKIYSEQDLAGVDNDASAVQTPEPPVEKIAEPVVKRKRGRPRMEKPNGNNSKPSSQSA